MFQFSRRIVLTLLAGLLLTVTAPVQAKDLLVFAAASLKNAAEDIGKAYEASGGGKVIYSWTIWPSASSSSPTAGAICWATGWC